ncbi:MAG: two-component sensor histidine kinase, partial [Kosmotogaceae bacterium]|nr:two-component sensor histidine kinase [Kosmotogaceae bacterium]
LGFAIYIDEVPIASFRAEPELFKEVTGSGTKGDYRFRSSVEIIEGQEEKFVTFYDLDESQEYLRFVFLTIFFSALLILLVVSVVGMVFTRKLINPFEEAGNQLERISRSGLKNSRVELSKTGEEVSKLEREINKSLIRIEQLIEDAKQISSRIAHELRTPLAVMKTNLQLSLTGDSSEETMREALKSTLGEVDKLIRLSEDYLLLSRTESSLPIEKNLINFSQLLLQTVEKILVIHSDKDLEIDIAPDIMIRGSGYMLEHVIINLLDNACRYTTDGSVEVKLSFDEHSFSLSISNKGRAIDFVGGEELEKAKGIKGYGLGLRVVRSILRAHGLKLDYVYLDGKNTFVIDFPFEK